MDGDGDGGGGSGGGRVLGRGRDGARGGGDDVINTVKFFVMSGRKSSIKRLGRSAVALCE